MSQNPSPDLKLGSFNDASRVEFCKNVARNGNLKLEHSSKSPGIPQGINPLEKGENTEMGKIKELAVIPSPSGTDFGRPTGHHPLRGPN